MTRPKRRGIQSIDTGIRLLEVLEKANGPLALKELSAKAGLDPSGAHRYLASFVRCGLVTQGADSRYDFGPRALRLGLAALQRSDPVQATERALPGLVAETGLTALLGSIPARPLSSFSASGPPAFSSTSRRRIPVSIDWMPRLARFFFNWIIDNALAYGQYTPTF